MLTKVKILIMFCMVNFMHISPLTRRESGNNFCQISVFGYPKRYDFVPSSIQTKRPETAVV